MSGYQTTTGYFRNPEANEKALFKNIFDGEKYGYETMYKTGDLARYLPDGSVAIIGRLDSQVKIRGNRVELSEVEVSLRNLDYVDDVTVQTIKNGSNNELVAYVVVSNGLAGEDLTNNIQEYIREHKPDYMVPTFVIGLDEIPINVNGKVDRHALPDVDLDSLQAEYIAPSNETEMVVVEAFEKVFDKEKIGIYDDFIRLGGDSLTAIHLLSYLEDYNVSAADILSLHTPYEIAKSIKDAHLDLDIYSIESGCPLNEPQLNVYLDILANDKQDSYLIPICTEISKEYDIDEICEALDSLLTVHPILNMCVSEKLEVPYLIKGSKPSITIESDVDEEFIIGFLTEPFDLHDCLSRFLIVENENEYLVFGVFHHIIFDALSEEVFKNDLSSLLEGANILIDDSFLKVAAFYNKIKEADEYEEATNFFESMLADDCDEGVLLDSICADGPDVCRSDLEVDLSSFDSFLNKQGINENVFFTSVFAYTLSRFVGNDKVLFNILENGRDRFKNYDAIGMHVTTLPILIDCENQNINSFMSYMYDMVYNVMRYNYYPFRILANKYNLTSDILFQYMPDWIGIDKYEDDNSSVDCSSVDCSSVDNSLYENIINSMNDLIADFSVDVIQKGTSFILNISYSKKYSKEFVERFIKSYKLILHQMLNVEELGDINYISNEDLDLLDNYNNTEYDLKYDDVLDAFNDNLFKYPDNKLVSMNDNYYTYVEGAFIADKIAERLVDFGIGLGDCVAFLTERSEHYMFSILAILSIGGVYVPLDDAHPNERISFILDDTGSKVLIVSDETYTRANDLINGKNNDITILNISDVLKEEFESVCSNGAEGSVSSKKDIVLVSDVRENFSSLVALDFVYGDLACILYTSGTTGVPKGVKISRKAILNFVEFYVNDSGMSNVDVYGLFASIGFDVSIKGIFSSIFSGACLNVVPEDIKLDINKLNAYFIKHGITHTHITTQVAKLFLNSTGESSLKELVTGGEKLGEIKYDKDYRLIDTYGPTEACVYVTSINEADKIDSSSVGNLLYNTKAYILDSDKRHVPIGAVGELYLAGYQISRGYLNREEETSESFLENPFDENDDYRIMYRTGDIARFLADGSIEIVGRRDGQVKVRGNRVELSEVESAIRNIGVVEDVVIQTIRNGNNNELVAYIVASESVDDGELNDIVCGYMMEHKPTYMVPSFVVQLDSIPLTVNGKVDKRALPDVDLVSLHSEYVAPSNDVEKDIVNAFEKVFNQERISIHDDFIRLGGDSLSAIKLISYLGDYNITVADVLSLHTPYEIAKNLKDISFDLDIYSLESGCPLNEPQLNVYLDILANDKQDSYIIPFFMEISKEYDIDSISDALTEILNVHPILGMCVSDEFEVPYLIKGSEPSITVESSVDNDFIVEFLNKSFDLKDSLCRFLIVENDENNLLFASFHHIIFDALSNDVFKHDLQGILDGESSEEDLSFLKISAFNQEMQNTEEYVDAHAFYDSMLIDKDDVGVLLDSVLADGPGTFKLDLNFDLKLFKSFLNDLRISENVLFTSAFAYALSRFAGSDKVLFNIIDNGRDRFNNFNSIGMFVNTLPLLVDCQNQEIHSFVDGISSSIYNVMKYNFYPFRLLANEYEIDSNIIFEFLPEWIADNEKYEDVPIEIYQDLISKMEDFIADFNVGLVQKGDTYSLNITYSDKYSKDMVERFAYAYDQILSEMIEKDNLFEINYTSLEDLKFLDKYNQTNYKLKYENVLDAFNHNLAEYPNNKLVSFKDKSYTYAESAFIANKIANQLKELGVSSQDNVAFLVNRSELYLFNVLAILSIGAVYVPLDLNLPEERAKFILEDTDSKVLIVSDDTYKYVEDISVDCLIFNVSDIFREEVSTLDSLPVVYGDLACILYTSGTTGVPKGVKITTKSIINVCEWYIEKYGFDCDDVYGMFSSIGFDVASFNINLVMCAGACLSIVPDEYKTDMSKLNEYFIEQGVSHAWITTSVGKLFMQSISYTSLDILMVGGEKLGEFESPQNFTLIDVCGPTEAFEHVYSIKNSEKIDSSSIGYLNYNTKAYLLDDEFRRVPVGAVGELYLSGYQLAEGYLNRDEKTRETFLSNPFDDDEEFNVLYRTGDMGRILPDGSFAIVGRRDSQVKIRGNRVELSEIESVIRNIDGIIDVTVQTINNNGVNEIIVYVVASESKEENILGEIIKNQVRAYKPDYMVPSFVVSLEDIPRNINGKVDRHALPEVDLDSLYVGYVAPTNEIEKHIMDAFELVFDQRISLFDDFVRIGGDSIKAIRVISFLQEKGIFCAAGDILDYKTPYLIAQHINEDVEIISYDATEGVIDLLPIQEYFFDQINLDIFLQQFVLKANENINKDILQNVFDELANIHDIFRAKYRFEDGKPIQEILPCNTRVCEINEYYIKDDFEEKMREIFFKSSESINIQNKLMDVSLIQYNDVSYLMIVVHHLLIDGVSWNNLLADLTYIYYRLKAGKEIELLRPYPYKNWIDDVKELVENISDEERQHWTNLNNLLDDSKIQGHSNVFAFNVDSNYDSENLLGLSEEEFFALAISRAYKKVYGLDIIFNRESHGRDESIANLNRTIGWFTSQYPVHVEVSSENDNVSLMKDVYSLKTAFKDVNHLGLNYSSLIYTNKEFDFKHCPVTFNFLSTEFIFKNELFESINHFLGSGGKISSDRFDSTSYGITFNIMSVGNSYLISGDYAMDTYLGDDFDDFIETFKSELNFLANYTFEVENIVCCLSEAQLGVYLDEKTNDKDTAYAVPGIVECGLDNSVIEIKEIIHAIIDKHPILRGRILDTDDMPLLICDSYPSIETVETQDYAELVKPFDLNKSLSRFFIIDSEGSRFVFYDMHHIISDATTRTIIENEFKKAFNGEFDSSLDLGFVQASHDSFESKFKLGYESAYEFFRNLFVDIDEVQYLLSDIDGSVGRVSLPIHGVREKVDSFVQDNGITIGGFLNSVFAYAYSRFTGGDKVYFAFTEHGRHEVYSEDALGMFVRTIPVIVDCKNKVITDYVRDVSDLILDAMSNSVYPFRLLAKEFNLVNNIAFEYNYDLNRTANLGDETVFSDYVDRVAEFLCVVNDIDDGFVVNINHLDNFSQDTAERFANVFKEVLIQFLDKNELKDIDYISKGDIDILDNLNQTEHSLKYDDILDAFNDNLAKYPSKALVSMDEGYYTYSESAFIADKIAESLRNHGIGEDDCVAFFVERSGLYMFCTLGIMSIGAVYVPIDDSYPDNRIMFMLKDTGAEVLIVSDKTYERAKKIVNNDVVILNISDILKKDVGTLTSLDVDYCDVGCILYTSGTTGIPKGVKITRHSIVNVANVYADKYGMGNDDVYGLFTSIGFDIASLALNAVIFAGASLCVIPDDKKLDMFNLNSFFIEHNVTYSAITAQVAKLFMQSVGETSLKLLSVGGEKLGEIKGPDLKLIDEYGATEEFGFISSIDYNDKIDSSSVGLLNYNTKAYILDNEFRRVPYGAIGELYVSGFQIADGYLNREEENANSFFENPFEDGDYGVMYASGDMVRLLPDGSIGFVGRKDTQVKIRGNRVELSEVESIIRKMDIVKDVTVQTIKNGSNNELVAYVVAFEDMDDYALKDIVCNYVADFKVEYMVPSFVIGLDKIPLTVNGKVDRSALPEVDLTSLHEEYLAPRTELEMHIVDAFENVFNQKDVGLNDDFIRLGGDSIKAIRVISFLGKYGISLTARDILNYKTPYLIAQNIDQDLEAVSYDDIEGVFDLLPIQEFFFDQIGRNDFSQEFILKASKNLDGNTLQNAINE